MGCGSSTVGQSDLSMQATDNNEKKPSAQNGDAQRENSNLGSPKKKSKKDNRVAPGGDSKDTINKENSIIHSNPPKPVPKGVAFDIVLDNSKIDGIISKNPPKRLQRLEPISGMPRLSAEMLAEKLRLAEVKRERQLEKKKQKSRRATSRRHKQLMEARKFEVQQQLTTETEEKLKLAEKNKEAKQKELDEKKQLREERARKVRERAKKLKQEGEGEHVDMDMVEKDEHYNDDDDSWLGENATSDYQSDLGDRIYSGHESPMKKHKPRSSAENRARASAFSSSTTDSFDYAFQRTPHDTTYHAGESKHDDFFDDDPKK